MRGFLAHFAPRGSQRILARLDHALRKIPVVVDAQQQHTPAVVGTPDHDHARGENPLRHSQS